MLTRVGRFLEEKALVSEGDRVLCMVSGGADSMAMLHILHSLAEGADPAFSKQFSLGICHINYGRRGGASDGDEIFVRRLGDELGIPVHVIQAPGQKRSNFQAWARDFRYLAAQNLCRCRGYSRIAVAHNQDDRVETFLYRLMTYSGRRSLVVMPPKRGRVIRPVLFASAAEIRAYCAETGLDYREDESNREMDYVRNQIRQLVVPRMTEIRADFRDRIMDTLGLLEDEEAVLEDMTLAAWHDAASSAPSSGGESGAGWVLDAARISGMPPAVARLVVRRWLSGAGPKVRLSRRLLDSILGLCASTDGSSSISLSDDLQVERRYDKLVFSPAATAPPAPSAGEDLGEAGEKEEEPEAVLRVPGRILFGDYEIEAVESPSWDVITSDPFQAVIDVGGIEPPVELTVRAWRPGDRFAPLGLEGTKSLQDLFTDEKVPRRERRRVPVVTWRDRIVWVGGLRVSEEFRVTDSSRRLIGLRARRRAFERAFRRGLA